MLPAQCITVFLQEAASLWVLCLILRTRVRKSVSSRSGIQITLPCLPDSDSEDNNCVLQLTPRTDYVTTSTPRVTTVIHRLRGGKEKKNLSVHKYCESRTVVGDTIFSVWFSRVGCTWKSLSFANVSKYFCEI